MLTSSELKELLKSREPVEVYNDQCRMWAEYAYIEEIVTQWSEDRKKFVVLAVCMDKNLRGTVRQTTDKVRRISRPAEPENAATAKNSTTETLAEIQARTLKQLKEDAKRNRY